MTHKLILYLRSRLPLLQNGLAERVQKSRKQIKERKNRTKKIRGTKKNAGAWSSRLSRAFCWVVPAAAAAWLAALSATLFCEREPHG